MKKVMMLIPALNPPDNLIAYVDELISDGFGSILLVDDGSSEKFKRIFDELGKRKECTVFRHAVNLGKGRALKNGINHFLNLENLDEYAGIITVDSDGQHAVADVKNVRDALLTNPDALHLGSRNFNLSHVPPKSKFGNKLTSMVFHLLYGMKLGDTQTGLRAIPTAMVPSFIDLAGERFEYEMNMLIECSMKKVSVKEIEIRTIYFDSNSETHFNPITDSLAIYGLLFKNFFKYMMSSATSFLIDILLFQIILMAAKDMDAGQRILVATIGSRLGSSIVNYAMNHKLVFNSKVPGKQTIVKYYILVVVQMLASAGLVAAIYSMSGIPETVIKIVVDSLLFLLSYRIQKKLVFN